MPDILLGEHLETKWTRKKLEIVLDKLACKAAIDFRAL